MKLSKNILSRLLTKMINESFSGTFPAVKIAAYQNYSVSPVDKSTENEISVSKFRPLNILSVFSKGFESINKNQIV